MNRAMVNTLRKHGNGNKSDLKTDFLNLESHVPPLRQRVPQMWLDQLN